MIHTGTYRRCFGVYLFTYSLLLRFFLFLSSRSSSVYQSEIRNVLFFFKSILKTNSLFKWNLITTAAVISPTNCNSRVTFYCNNQRRLAAVYYNELSMALRQGTILSYCRLMAHPFPLCGQKYRNGTIVVRHKIYRLWNKLEPCAAYLFKLGHFYAPFRVTTDFLF